MKDPELIVKVAALRTLTQLTSELQDIVTDYHEQLLPLIIEIVDSASSVMVYKYATYALDGLIEFMSHEAMGKYIEPLMHKLFHMLGQANSVSLKLLLFLLLVQLLSLVVKLSPHTSKVLFNNWNHLLPTLLLLKV